VTSFCFYLWFREKQAFQKIIHVKPYSAHIYSLIKSRFAKNRLSQNYFLFILFLCGIWDIMDKNDLIGLLPGLFQGITRVSISYPADVIKIQMQKQLFAKTTETVKYIIKNGLF
jgi:hypothetical protein